MCFHLGTAWRACCAATRAWGQGCQGTGACVPNPGMSPAGPQHNWAHLTFSRPRTKPCHLPHHPVAACHLVFFLPVLPRFGCLHSCQSLLSPQSTLLFFRLFTPLQMGKKKTRLQRLPCSLPLRRQTEPLTAHMGARSSTCCELIFT